MLRCNFNEAVRMNYPPCPRCAALNAAPGHHHIEVVNDAFVCNVCGFAWVARVSSGAPSVTTPPD